MIVPFRKTDNGAIDLFPQDQTGTQDTLTCPISDADDIDAIFELFWNAMPKPWVCGLDGKKEMKSNSKKSAKEKFIRLVNGGVDPRYLTRQAKLYASKLQNDPTHKPQFTPMTVTWLNKEGWKDIDDSNVHDIAPEGEEVRPRWTKGCVWRDLNTQPPYVGAPLGAYCGRWKWTGRRWQLEGAR